MGHITVEDGITGISSPQKGGNVVAAIILLHFWVRPFCGVVSLLIGNQNVLVYYVQRPRLIISPYPYLTRAFIS